MGSSPTTETTQLVHRLFISFICKVSFRFILMCPSFVTVSEVPSFQEDSSSEIEKKYDRHPHCTPTVHTHNHHASTTLPVPPSLRFLLLSVFFRCGGETGVGWGGERVERTGCHVVAQTGLELV